VARCTKCGGELAALGFSMVCAPCRSGEKNPTANELWIPGADTAEMLRAAVDTDPGDRLWWALKKRAAADGEFARRAAAQVAPVLADRCAIDQLWMRRRLPNELWPYANEVPAVKDAIAVAEARAAEERPLLDAIASAPALDEPRLVYADWLLEQPTAEERARGERVHAEVVLASLPSGDPREGKLLATLAALWKQPFARHWRNRALGTASHRGVPLISDDERTLGDGLPDDPWILGAVVEEPISEMWHASDHQLKKAPHLGRLIALDLSSLSYRDAAEILRSPHLGRLTFLRLELDNDVIAALPRALPDLLELELTNSGSGDVSGVFMRELPSLRRVLVCGKAPQRLTGPVEIEHRPEPHYSRARLVSS
jgi:uncharacterized protein (TIGR02996 family)